MSGLDTLSHYSPVEVVGVRLPLYGLYGGGAELQCRYTSVMPVYSVKWYKNGKEFYRLVTALAVMGSSQLAATLEIGQFFNRFSHFYSPFPQFFHR